MKYEHSESFNLDYTIVNIINPEIHNLKQSIYLNQQNFYAALLQMIKNMKIATEYNIEALNQLHSNFYQKKTRNFYKLFSNKNEELGISSSLNMNREINKSNESLINALKNYVIT